MAPQYCKFILHAAGIETEGTVAAGLHGWVEHENVCGEDFVTCKYHEGHLSYTEDEVERDVKTTPSINVLAAACHDQGTKKQ